jgi:3-deoxy-manno-octulosonate cytidylyltransferase (CMP-KDO synthetase)
MSINSVLGVIPARIGSERLPRKPLHPIAGRPLVEWVWRRASRLGLLDRIVIATDSDEVAAVVRGFGADVELTSPLHASGTDRVAEVAARPAFHAFGIIANIQGDEPFITAAQLGGAIERVRDGWDVGTVAAPLETLEAWRDPAVVKVVCGARGRALYFSRAPVPAMRDREPSSAELAGAPFLRHIGVYAYTRDALARWAALPAAPLEHTERLEQLRPLAAGLRIGVTLVDRSDGGVDTSRDAERAAQRLAASAAPSTSTVT